MLSHRKNLIEQSFGQKVASYQRHAHLQRETARKLCYFLPDEAPATILEIGCGTGFLTEELQKKYPKSEILAIDISKNMVASCRQKFTGYQNLNFEIVDGETFSPHQKFDLIVSNLCVQWFNDPVQGLKRLTEFLKDDGYMFYTTLGQDGFQEWKDTLEKLRLSSGIIGSPHYNGIFHEDKKIITYQNALDFLKNFKKIGAHQPRPDYIPLSMPQLKQACHAHDKAYQGRITWQILYGALDSLGGALKR